MIFKFEWLLGFMLSMFFCTLLGFLILGLGFGYAFRSEPGMIWFGASLVVSLVASPFIKVE